MTPLALPGRPLRVDLDYAAWHAHVAARAAPACPLRFAERRPVGARPAPADSVTRFDLATWRARLAGTTRRAA